MHISGFFKKNCSRALSEENREVKNVPRSLRQRVETSGVSSPQGVGRIRWMTRSTSACPSSSRWPSTSPGVLPRARCGQRGPAQPTPDTNPVPECWQKTSLKDGKESARSTPRIPLGSAAQSVPIGRAWLFFKISSNVVCRD